MATEIIHRHEPKPFYPYWQVERQPEGVTDPMVVRFRKVGKNGTLLDQNARWSPLGWDCKRWVPTAPTVPQWLLEKVVHHMLTLPPQTMSTALCSEPGCQRAHGNWPGPGPTGELCQDHWEAYCARQWWQACTAIDEAGLMIWCGGPAAPD